MTESQRQVFLKWHLVYPQLPRTLWQSCIPTTKKKRLHTETGIPKTLLTTKIKFKLRKK